VSLSISIAFYSNRPLVPSRKPYNLPLFYSVNLNKPSITLLPPGAYLPLKTIPILTYYLLGISICSSEIDVVFNTSTN
jgi:hypothetical protein